MNEEIKLRAWDKNRKKMICAFGLISEDKHAYQLIINEDGRLLVGNYQDNGDWQEPELTEYAKRKDIEGNELFVGDIVEYEQVTYGETRHKYKTVVKFEEYGYTPMKYESIVGDDDYYSCKIENIKKIGNIFENPEISHETKWDIESPDEWLLAHNKEQEVVAQRKEESPRSNKLIKKCAEVMVEMLRLGFHKDDLLALEKLWWQLRDQNIKTVPFKEFFVEQRKEERKWTDAEHRDSFEAGEQSMFMKTNGKQYKTYEEYVTPLRTK